MVIAKQHYGGRPRSEATTHSGLGHRFKPCRGRGYWYRFHDCTLFWPFALQSDRTSCTMRPKVGTGLC